MKYCRMCENKIHLKSLDGLCSKCHMELCFIEPGKCGRCVQIAETLTKWLTLEEEFEDEENQKE